MRRRRRVPPSERRKNIERDAFVKDLGDGVYVVGRVAYWRGLRGGQGRGYSFVAFPAHKVEPSPYYPPGISPYHLLNKFRNDRGVHLPAKSFGVFLCGAKRLRKEDLDAIAASVAPRCGGAEADAVADAFRNAEQEAREILAQRVPAG
jgi:hypothetical protein